ncbi:MAG: amidohydrolase family protein, partial [bacterium]|nr:amidohydrolase family protein [bacterium]
HVAYCPRTHAAFGHAPHRFGEMLSAGINVCIGTDSLASTPSLSVLDELRQVRRTIEQADTHELIEMGTLRGARALGLDRVVGSLEPGKQADMVVVPLARGADCDPGENLLRSTLPPTRVYIAGKPIPPIGSAESAGT